MVTIAKRMVTIAKRMVKIANRIRPLKKRGIRTRLLTLPTKKNPNKIGDAFGKRSIRAKLYVGNISDSLSEGVGL